MGTEMDGLAPLTIALSVRPLRSVIFVPRLREVPWQRLFRFVLRVQSGVWGGWGNLVLPLTLDEANENELLWKVLDAFDADSYHSLPVNVGDLAELAPDEYQRRYQQRREELADLSPEFLVDHIPDELRTEVVAPFLLPEALQELLVRRLAPLATDNRRLPVYGELADPPAWPLVAIEHLRPLPTELRVYTGWSDEDLALMGVSAHGELTPRLRQALTDAEVKVNEQDIANPHAAWRMALELRPGVPSRELAMLGLAQYFRPGASLPGLVLCVGDEPWDFAFALARERMAGDARWLPSRAADDPEALAAVTRLATQVRRRSTQPVTLCSVSSPEAVERLAQALADVAKGLLVEIRNPLELVPAAPGRLYERERVGFYQSVVVHNGMSPGLPTPLPQNVDAESANEIRWMTDVDAEGWSAIRHPGLSRHVLSQPITAEVTRCGRENVSYFCPGPMTWTSRSLETQTVRPKLAPLTFFQQVEAVLSDASWTAEPSDKGIYLQQSAALFGGTAGLIEALSDERARLLTAFLAKGKDAPGWRLNDQRRYLVLPELRRLGVDEDQTDELVMELEGNGALIRGLVLKCARCRGARFYRLEELGQTFRCTRCWLEQPLTSTSWMVGPEPPWRYALAEVVYHLLEHNGDLPLLSAHDFMLNRAMPGRSGEAIQFTGELAIVDAEGTDWELDIVITDGTDLWVGEATTKTRLEGTKAKELRRLGRLHAAAEQLSARGVLLITSEQWEAATVERACSVFPGIWPSLEIVEHGRRAPRWTSPPAQEQPEEAASS